MRFDDLRDALDSTGLPWATGDWGAEKAPGLPYMALLPGDPAWLHADNANALKVARWTLEVYTQGPGFETWALVADALSASGASFDESGGGPAGGGAWVEYFALSTIG